MKKLLLFIIISIIIPYKLYAVDISAGLSAWYAWYKPSSGEKVDPAFLYAPVLSVKINDDFNLTFVYYYGEFEYSYGKTTKRHDSDIALNYRLNNYLKIFFGAKYRRIDVGSNEGANLPVTIHSLKANSIGPGLGLNVVYPLFANIYLISTGAGLFAVRKAEYSLGRDIKDSRYYQSYGYNLTLGLAYYIAPASTVINLGGRYQCFIDRKDTGIRDSFYGITLTATYSFEI